MAARSDAPDLSLVGYKFNAKSLFHYSYWWNMEKKLTMILPMFQPRVAQVLRAAAWTYVAAFITSLTYFLLHLLPLVGGRRE